MGKAIGRIIKGGERSYVYPYALSTLIYPKNPNKILWFETESFQPDNLGDIFQHRQFPWIRYHVKNFINMIRMSIKYKIRPYNYYNVYPVLGMEMSPLRLGLPYSLCVDESGTDYRNSAIEPWRVIPSSFHVLMHLDWELEKIEAGTSTLEDFQKEDIVAFEVWKRKMYESGYEVHFMFELDT